jgi:hypothetical protein
MANKFFPLWLHFLVGIVAIGFAVGLNHEPDTRPLFQYTANGFATGMILSWFGRFMVS